MTDRKTRKPPEKKTPASTPPESAQVLPAADAVPATGLSKTEKNPGDSAAKSGAKRAASKQLPVKSPAVKSATAKLPLAETEKAEIKQDDPATSASETAIVASTPVHATATGTPVDAAASATVHAGDGAATGRVPVSGGGGRGGGGAPPAGPARPAPGFFQSPGVKFIMIGFISVILLIPALLVWGLTEERARRADDVSARIASGWGGPQTINGPYLAVPYEADRSQTIDGKIVIQRVTEWALLMPETLNIDADLSVEERKLSIYTLPVYGSKLKISGRFGANLLEDLSQFGGPPNLDRAVLVMNIADITGIRSEAGVRIDGSPPLAFEPGMKDISASSHTPADPYGSTLSKSGVHRAIAPGLIDKGFSFNIDIALNGSRNFAVAPAGQTTVLSAKANWPHPGFEGLFLPEEKSIEKDRFEAKWTIPYLARGIDKSVSSSILPLSDSLMIVNLVEPVKFYQVIARTLKYSIGFISVVFLAVFIIELKGGRMVHWIQYVLTGLALVVFYVLLLALAEHTGFETAYLLAALATTLLIASYVGVVTASRRSGVALGIVLALAYAVLYLILREDEYALLAGALISFVTIAATMFATRNVDWSGGRRQIA